MRSSLIFGKVKESEALVWFLKNRPGSLLITHNYRSKLGEIDLIFEERQTTALIELVFVEVRATSTQVQKFYGIPETFSRQKRRRLHACAQHFMLIHYQGKASSQRFDLLFWETGQWSHLPNAW